MSHICDWSVILIVYNQAQVSNSCLLVWMWDSWPCMKSCGSFSENYCMKYWSLSFLCYNIIWHNISHCKSTVDLMYTWNYVICLSVVYNTFFKFRNFNYENGHLLLKGEKTLFSQRMSVKQCWSSILSIFNSLTKKKASLSNFALRFGLDL